MTEVNEIEVLRLMLERLTAKIENDKKSLISPAVQQNDADIYLKLHDMQLAVNKSQKKISEVNKKNQDLVKENEKLKKNNKVLGEKNLEHQSAKKQHEDNMRQLFKLYKKDKEQMYKYQIQIARLEKEIDSLKNQMLKQEDRYNNLKNQMSYRLGNRLMGVKNTKDIFNLPKKVFDDYIEFKAQPNKKALALMNQSKNSESSLPLVYYNSFTECILFKNETIFSLAPKFTSVIFDHESNGSIDIRLFGVTPKASVDMEVQIRSLGGDSIISTPPNLNMLTHIKENDVFSFHYTLEAIGNESFLNIIKIEGNIELLIKKTRGVPSFISLTQVQEDRSIVSRKNILGSEEKIEFSKPNEQVEIPKLRKKSLIFREALEIQKEYGTKVAESFIKKYIAEDQKQTLNIFYANNNLENEELWLEFINKYISHYGMQKMELINKDRDKFYRINSRLNYKVEEKLKITVIMPAFNAEKTIEHSIRSILNQTWRNLELIVINDCSTDRTLEVINKLAKFDKRLKVISNPKNVGAYVSKNLGLSIATGDYITGHDADDWAHPQRLEQHIKLIRSEDIPPRASNTRMIRMEENGYLPLYPFGAFCHDGVMRVASITCMFETKFLREVLGGWDCSRFGADSEIISRCKKVIGDEFKNYQMLSMICLDDPNSLTNHPIHGVSKTTGISPSRKFYRDQWTKWHSTLNKDDVYLPFPHFDRKFPVPEGTEIPNENILSAIQNLENEFGL